MFREVQCILKLDCAKAAFAAGARCRAFRHYSWVGCFALRSTVTWPYHCYLPCLSGASEAAASAAPAAPAAAPVVGPTEIQESEETEELRHRALFFRHQLGKLWIWRKPGRWSFLADSNPWGLEWLELGMFFFKKLDRLENFVLCDDVTDKIVGQSNHLIALWIFAPPRCYLAFCRSYPRHISTWNGVACLDIFFEIRMT